MKTTANTIHLPRPHAGQAAVLASSARFKWVSAGRRWRKTTMAVMVAVERALRGESVFWGAPTYDQCRVGWKEIYKAAGGVADFNISRMEITFPTGGSIIFRSLDNPEHARAHTADGMIMDEAALCPQEAWYDVLRPIISDTKGWGLFIFTPAGHNWVWRECVNAHDHMDSEYWQIPTLGVRIENRKLIRAPHPLENPYFSFDEAVKMYETQPESTFRAEFLADFLSNEGAVFRKIEEAATLTEREPESGHTYVAGIDWGQQNDFTSIVIMDRDAREMVKLDRFNGVDWSLQRGRVRAIYDKYKPIVIHAEQNSIGGPNVEALQAEGLPIRPFVTTAQSKPPLIESLVLAFERGEIRILNNIVLKSELMAYERRVSPTTNRSQYSAPVGIHDDTVISLALAWLGCHTGITAEQMDAWQKDKPNPDRIPEDLKRLMRESGLKI